MLSGDDDSPWARDDWMPEPAQYEIGSLAEPTELIVAPESVARPVRPGAAHSGALRAPRRPRRRTVGVGLAMVVAIGLAIVLLGARSAIDTTTDTAPDTGTGSGAEAGIETGFDDGTEVVVGAESAPTESAAVEDEETVTPSTPPAVLVRPGSGVPEQASIARPGTVSRLVPDEAADWTEWAIEVPAPLDAAPELFEIVVVTRSALLHRIEFPTGRVRSLDISELGPDASVAVGADALAISSARGSTLIRDDGPSEIVPVSDGVVLVQPWPGTSAFFVTTSAASTSTAAQYWILDEAGQLSMLEADSFELEPFRTSFLPSSEMVIDRAGGVYAVALDRAVRRLSTGDLIANGVSHFAIEECDEVLQCAQFIVDSRTGARSPAMLDGVAANGAADPSARISPDGSHVVYRDYSRRNGIRVVVEAATGAELDIGAVSAFVDPDTWAPDGSGLFIGGGPVRFQLVATGEVIEIDGLFSSSAVTVRPPN